MFRTLLMRGNFFTKLPKSILASSNGCETWWSCSWCQYEAIEYLTCSFGHVQHPMLNFVYLRSSRLKVLHFWLDSCIVNKGEKFELEIACWMHLEDFQVVSSHFWALVWSGQSSAPVWPVRVLTLFICWAPVSPVVVTGLTGQSWADAATLFSSGVLHAFVQGELH
jgi:hypothetical protein